MFIVNYQRYYKIPIFSGLTFKRFSSSRILLKVFKFANTIKRFSSLRILLKIFASSRLSFKRFSEFATIIKGFQVRDYH